MASSRDRPGDPGVSIANDRRTFSTFHGSSRSSRRMPAIYANRCSMRKGRGGHVAVRCRLTGRPRQPDRPPVRDLPPRRRGRRQEPARHPRPGGHRPRPTPRGLIPATTYLPTSRTPHRSPEQARVALQRPHRRRRHLGSGRDRHRPCPRRAWRQRIDHWSTGGLSAPNALGPARRHPAPTREAPRQTVLPGTLDG